VPDGPLSNKLFNLKPGSTLLSAPRAGGFFTLSQVPAAQYLWLCATGTAIGPYLSMLRTPEPWESFERVTLLHGVRDHSEMTYLNVLQEIKLRHGHQFDFFHSVTRETNTLHFTQRIPELLDTGELENAVGLTLDAETSQVMLSGNSGMVNGCVAALTARGFKKNQRRDPGQITIEIYQ
jgi:ferredoxin--NADP+ reductase